MDEAHADGAVEETVQRLVEAVEAAEGCALIL